MSYINIVLNIIPTWYPLWGLYIVSAHRMVMENRPVDPGSIQGSHRPIFFTRIKHRTRADDILCKTEYSWSYRRFRSQKPYYTNASSVPRSLQSWVSTIQTAVLTADVFQHKNTFSHTLKHQYLYRYVCVHVKPFLLYSSVPGKCCQVRTGCNTSIKHIFGIPRTSVVGLLSYKEQLQTYHYDYRGVIMWPLAFCFHNLILTLGVRI